VLQESGVTPLEIRNLVSFPSHMALIMETGCWQCGEPPTGLRRMYKDPDREMRIEQIFSVEQMGLPPRTVGTVDGPKEPPPLITGLAVAPGASEMLVSVCIEGPCLGNPDGGSPPGRTAVFGSTDGRVTWNLIGDDYNPTLSVFGYIAPGIALASQTSPGGPKRSLLKFPSLERLEPVEELRHPVLSADGELIWGSYLGPPVYGSGQTFLALAPGMFPGAQIGTFSGDQMMTYSDGAGPFPLTWRWDSHDPEPLTRHFVSLVSPEGVLLQTYETSRDSNQMLTAMWAPDGRVLVTMVVGSRHIIGAPDDYVGLLPALLDLDSGQYVTVKEPFLEDDFGPGRDIIHAVQTGPFARVVNTGSCLNIRESPDLHSTILTCAADGVLLRTSASPYTVGDTSWVFVTAPDGTSGAAATEFLEW
jgi:hypothetical protein